MCSVPRLSRPVAVFGTFTPGEPCHGLYHFYGQKDRRDSVHLLPRSERGHPLSATRETWAAELDLTPPTHGLTPRTQSRNGHDLPLKRPPGMEQAGLGRGRHFNPVQAEARGNRRVAVLIQVVANRPGHRASLPKRAVAASTAVTSPSAPRQSDVHPRWRPECRRGGHSSRRGPRAPGRG